MSDATHGAALIVTAPENLRGLVVAVGPGRSGLGRYGHTPLDAVGVSRNHAWVDEDAGAVWITDNHSTNGTFVNSTRIDRPTRLTDGDQVEIGAVRLTARLAAAEPTGPVSQPDVSASQVTRYLCAAVHVDRRFREHVLDEVVNQPYRAVCPSYGVDLVAVVCHALAAQRQRLLRDLALLGLLFAAVLSILSADGLTPDSAVIPALVVIGLLAWFVVAFDAWWLRYVVLVGGLSLRAPHARRPKRPSGGRLARRLDAITGVQSSNVVVFSGFTPFVGSGYEDENWSFAIDIEKGAKDPATGRRKTPKSFSAGDLYTALAANLATIGLPNLRVEERLLVNGVDVRQIPALLPNRHAAPIGFAAPEVLHAVRDRNRGVARTYLCVEVTGWRGQLVVTIFVRVVRLQGSLYLEWTSYVLPPLRDEYYDVDRISPRLGAAIAYAIGHGLVYALPALVSSPFMVLHRLDRWLDAWRSRSRQRDQILADRNFDYGARSSIREEAAGATYKRYFLSLDSEMYTKVVQVRLLKHIFDFLELHDLDTSDFAAQQTIINNSQSYNVSGNLGSGVAVGPGAQGGSHNKVAQPPAGGVAK
jgi:FHA domain-containing protein